MSGYDEPNLTDAQLEQMDARTRQVLDALVALPEVAAPADLTDRIMARIEAEPAHHQTGGSGQPDNTYEPIGGVLHHPAWFANPWIAGTLAAAVVAILVATPLLLKPAGTDPLVAKGGLNLPFLGQPSNGGDKPVTGGSTANNDTNNPNMVAQGGLNPPFMGQPSNGGDKPVTGGSTASNGSDNPDLVADAMVSTMFNEWDTQLETEMEAYTASGASLFGSVDGGYHQNGGSATMPRAGHNAFDDGMFDDPLVAVVGF